MENSHLLLLFQDEVSKKVFWWEGKRYFSDHLTLAADEKTYSHWPQEMYQVRKSNYKTFTYMVYGFGAEALLTDEERQIVQKQKIKMVKALEELRQ